MPSCVVKWCRSHSDMRKTGITFHKFPQDEVQRHRWTSAVRLERREPGWTPSAYSVLCALHFGADDMYALEKDGVMRIRVKKTAIPICTMVSRHASWVPSDIFARPSSDVAKKNLQVKTVTKIPTTTKPKENSEENTRQSNAEEPGCSGIQTQENNMMVFKNSNLEPTGPLAGTPPIMINANLQMVSAYGTLTPIYILPEKSAFMTNMNTNMITNINTNVDTNMTTNMNTKINTNVDTNMITNLNTDVDTNMNRNMNTNLQNQSLMPSPVVIKQEDIEQNTAEHDINEPGCSERETKDTNMNQYLMPSPVVIKQEVGIEENTRDHDINEPGCGRETKDNNTNQYLMPAPMVTKQEVDVEENTRDHDINDPHCGSETKNNNTDEFLTSYEIKQEDTCEEITIEDNIPGHGYSGVVGNAKMVDCPRCRHTFEIQSEFWEITETSCPPPPHSLPPPASAPSHQIQLEPYQAELQPKPLTPTEKKLSRQLAAKTELANRRNLKVKNLQRQCRRLRKRLLKAKGIIGSLRKKDPNILGSLTGFPKDVFRIILRKTKTGRRLVKITPAVKRFALTVTNHSPAAYKYVRSQLLECLPHPVTVAKWQ